MATGENMQNYDAVCVTLVNNNLLIRPVDADLFTRDITIVDDYNMIVGGDGTNQAVVLASLGKVVGISAKIGSDTLGEMAIESLNQRKVDSSNVVVDPNGQTAICVVMIKENGERNFVVKRGACESFSVEDIQPELLKHTKILNIGSLFTFKELHGEDMANLLRTAQSQGVITSADCMYDGYGLGAEDVLRALPYLDYFFPSFDEAKYLTNEVDTEKIANTLISRGVKTVVLKLGANGCLVKKGTRPSQYYESFSVPVVDTTGAGDNFIAGYLYGVLEGWTTDACAVFASAVAAISVGAIGANGAVKSVEQVDIFLRERGFVMADFITETRGGENES
jgi:sugar/nucleoside kinase (ribokinase family)